MLETLALLFPAPTCLSSASTAVQELPPSGGIRHSLPLTPQSCLQLLTELFSAMVFLSTLVIPHMCSQELRDTDSFLRPKSQCVFQPFQLCD